MSSRFTHYDLELIKPEFDSSITDLIIELDHLRRKKIGGTTPASIFFQLKRIFHTLESIGSAKIEGNNTTITDFIENKSSEIITTNEDILEIENIEKSMLYIDENIDNIEIQRLFTSELHKHIVEGLSSPPKGEGDKNPGLYRPNDISISKSEHKPPAPFQINGYMDDLFKFINTSHPSKYDLLKTAIAHHRFVWIHPFGNGNGRTVRLFTYAMLVKQGFNVNLGRIVNPSAVFCNDRDLYYKYLSIADKGTKNGILEWSEYVLSGLKTEIEKIDRLSDYKYLKKNILYSALAFSRENNRITEIEYKILKIAIDKKIIQAADLQVVFPDKHNAEISRNIRRLKDKQLLTPEKENGRKYIISFQNKILLKGIIRALDENGFLPINNE